MLCPRCGREVDKPADYCPHCGFTMASKPHDSARTGTTGELSPLDDDPQTEVLVEGYGDFHDTVVESAVKFDSALFAAAQQGRGSNPAGGSRGSTPSAIGVEGASAHESPSRASASGQARSREAAPDAWEQTWVLDSAGQPAAPHGSPSAHGVRASGRKSGSARSTGAAGAPRSKQVPAGAASSGRAAAAPANAEAGGAWQTAPLPAPASIAVGQADQNRPLIIAIAAIAVVAVVIVGACLAIAFWPSSDAGRAGSPSSSDDAAHVPVASASASSASSQAASSAGDGGAAFETDSKHGEGDAGGGDSPYGASTSSSSFSGSDESPYDAGTTGRDSTRVNTNAFTDADAYRILTEHYGKMGDYDKQIAKAAQDFNASYKDSSKQARSTRANTASNLKSQIKSSWNTLKDIDMPFWSKNYDDWETMCECYECLWYRIDGIDRAWTISLSYDEPEKHESEILAPVKDTQYKTRFASLYASISLTRP